MLFLTLGLELYTNLYASGDGACYPAAADLSAVVQLAPVESDLVMQYMSA